LLVIVFAFCVAMMMPNIQAGGPLENVDILSIAAGKDFSLVVTVDGNVFSFGGNDYSTFVR
jgi:alpha-tubulin suppressor-like RCC1 family protein